MGHALCLNERALSEDVQVLQHIFDSAVKLQFAKAH